MKTFYFYFISIFLPDFFFFFFFYRLRHRGEQSTQLKESNVDVSELVHSSKICSPRLCGCGLDSTTLLILPQPLYSLSLSLSRAQVLVSRLQFWSRFDHLMLDPMMLFTSCVFSIPAPLIRCSGAFFRILMVLLSIGAQRSWSLLISLLFFTGLDLWFVHWSYSL